MRLALTKLTYVNNNASMHLFRKSFAIVSCVFIVFVSLSTTTAAQEQSSTNTITQKPYDKNDKFRWICDDLFTYLRAGPGQDYRLIGSVTAGTQIQLLQVDHEAGYADIIDHRQQSSAAATREVPTTV